MTVTYTYYNEGGRAYRRGSDGSVWTHDPGGETNFGISKRSYPNVDVRNLTWEGAKEIYHRDYWIASGADKLSWPLCLTHFDFAVNAGVGRARQTLAASAGDFAQYQELRRQFYRSIPGFVHFGPAWLRRVADVEEEARK